jgi:hypothetical protein
MRRAATGGGGNITDASVFPSWPAALCALTAFLFWVAPRARAGHALDGRMCNTQTLLFCQSFLAHSLLKNKIKNLTFLRPAPVKTWQIAIEHQTSRVAFIPLQALQ